MDKPISSRLVSGGTRVYYVDTFRDGNGSHYLSISEIPTERNKGNSKRRRIFVHAERLEEFREAVNAAIDGILQGAD